MKLTQLFESDESLRAIEREARAGDDPSALIKLAHHYLRTEDPRMEELIESLRVLEDPAAQKLIMTWADQNEIPTAEDFVLNLTKTRDGISFLEASDRAKTYKFWLVDSDSNGRGGYGAWVEIWESPAGGSVWLVMDSGDEANYRFNYGIVDPEDHASAKEEGGEGILDWYRDYLN